jgi:hypothetical protein
MAKRFGLRSAGERKCNSTRNRNVGKFMNEILLCLIFVLLVLVVIGVAAVPDGSAGSGYRTARSGGTERGFAGPQRRLCQGIERRSQTLAEGRRLNEAQLIGLDMTDENLFRFRILAVKGNPIAKAIIRDIDERIRIQAVREAHGYAPPLRRSGNVIPFRPHRPRVHDNHDSDPEAA